MNKIGYKQTEIGLIPEDWEVVKLKNEINLLNGYAFSSAYFAKEGPIVITPGNFKLSGGLNFENSKNIRFSGNVKENMILKNNDLVLVMTDLTPSCNLLGKSGIIETNEIVLHNQRIGKITISKKLSKLYLSYYFNSEYFSKRMKSTATGSTVRHTSKPTILNTIIPFPPKPEQTAIAQVLSDTDALIDGLKALIAKKQAMKQGTMQELLTGKTRLKDENGKTFEGEWEEKMLGTVADCLDNLRIPLNSSQREKMKGNIPYCGANGVVDYVDDYVIDDEFILMAEDGGYFDEYKTRPIAYKMNGKCWVNNHAHILKAKTFFSHDFLFYTLVHKNILNYIVGGTRAKLNKTQLLLIEILAPNSLKEQTAIARVLSDMDAEIELLETRLQKTEQLKQGMMQELLTGRTRLDLSRLGYQEQDNVLGMVAEQEETYRKK